MNLCNDDNSKVIEIEFDTGSLNKKDVWKICNECNLKPQFQKFRIAENKLGDSI